ILIVGAGEAGVLALRELKKNFNFNIIGFVDDNISKRGLQLHGKKIFGGRACVKNIVSKYDISEIIIAMPSATGEVIRNIISCCQFEEVKLRIIPGMYEILSGEVEVKLRDVQPEDLLGRETVKIDEVAITAFVKNKRVLVTGGAGSIGSELVRQIVRFKPERVIIIDHNENDLYFLEREFQGSDSKCGVECIVADCKSVSVLKHVFSKHLPQIVFHTAAFKHVPLMESNLFSAIENNVIGSRNLIYASEHYGVESFVLISSDKAVNPTNIMGATKRITEKLLQAKSQKSRTNFMAVRFGNVLGSKGSVIPLFEKQIKEGKKVTVTHPDVTRFFMTIKEAVQLVVQASTLGKGNGEIFVLDMGEQIKILDFARNLIQLSGLRPEEDIEIEFIGLRPGEKLYEEPLNDIEKGQSTKYDKIFVTRPEKVDIKEIIRQIKQLEGFVRLRDRENAVTKIKEMVPTAVLPNFQTSS
ncbi:MAG: polysaccharide biosynthesis protein, partial [Candidatus Omnitrophica bacterium]|nr:polysaccharide biosynthesis protein [Candidatus Omnitrophota bacterium]